MQKPDQPDHSKTAGLGPAPGVEPWPPEMQRGIEALCEAFEPICRKEYRKPELRVLGAEEK